MAKGHGVSGNTHTQQQVNHYANQHNPNNAAHQANNNNHANQCNPTPSIDMKNISSTPRFLILSKICIHTFLLSVSLSQSPKMSFFPCKS